MKKKNHIITSSGHDQDKGIKGWDMVVIQDMGPLSSYSSCFFMETPPKIVSVLLEQYLPVSNNQTNQLLGKYMLYESRGKDNKNTSLEHCLI